MSSPRRSPRPEPTASRPVAIALALILLLVGCDAAPPSAPLRIATSPWLGTEPLFLARELGELPPREVQLVELVDVPQVVAALLNGAVDGAALTLAEALNLTARHPHFRIVLVTDYCDGADVLFAQPGIQNVAGLVGRRIGLDDTALSVHVLNRALQSAGLSLADIHIKTLSPDEQAEAFAKGELDAVVAYDPTLSRVRALGGKVLFDTSSIPAEISDVIVVRTDGNRERLVSRTRRLLDGWFAAVAYLERDRRDAAARMAPRLQLEPAQIEAALAKTQFPDRATNGRHLGASPPAYIDVANRLKATLTAAGAAGAAASVEQLFDRDLAARLYP